METVLSSLDIPRTTFYRHLKQWKGNGVLAYAHKILYLPQLEEIHQAHNIVMDRWPSIIERILNIASGGNDKTALAAAMWLKREIISPALDENTDEGEAEIAYASRDGDFDPTHVEKIQ